MKSDLVHSIVQLDGSILKQLVTEVKETVATDVEMPGARKSSFGRLKLWDMRRRSRFAGIGLKQPRITTGIGY